MQSSITERLAGYVAGETLTSIPEDVIKKAKLCVLDSVGCLLGAYASPIAQIMAGFTADISGSDDTQVAGSGLGTDCGTTAFSYATLINALDYDDIYKKGHPGATIISTALAVGDKIACSGAELIEAVVVGYEVSARTALSLLQSAPRKTIHGHGTWQTIGAAATAAKLLRLGSRQTAHAIAIAAANAPVASVMKTVYGSSPSMAKNNFGQAAQVGVNSAFLARRGFEGPLDVFEGETGFWRMFGADGGDLASLIKGLGELYEIREVGFKPYSCCRILQSSIEAAVDVFRQAGVDSRNGGYRNILVSGPAILCGWPFNNRHPDTMWAAQFSAPYTIALALLGIEPGAGWFSNKQLSDPVTTALTEKIELRPHQGEEDTVHHRPSHHAARADLTLDDGRTFNSQIKIAKGEAANPLSVEFLSSKFLRLATGRVGAGTSVQILDTITELETLASVTPLLRDIRATCAPAPGSAL
jgi:2-methylcitrate dehydratase PrpD